MIEERALLVKVTVHTWTGIITDQSASEEIAQNKGANPDFVRVKKNLLGKALKEIQEITSNLREYVRTHTLPWFDGNWRILPASKYFEFAQTIGDFKTQFEKAVRSFYSKYPALVQEAQKLLGSLYRSEDFPPPDAVFDLFKIEVDFAPIPRGSDFRLEMLSEAQEEIKQKVEERYREAFKRIKEQLALRITELCERIEKCLTGKKVVITQALMRDMKEMPNLLDALNVIEDPDVKTAAEKIRKLADYDVQTVRKSPLIQGLFLSTAKSLKRLLSQAERNPKESFSQAAC